MPDLGDLLMQKLGARRVELPPYQPRETKKFVPTDPETEADKLEMMERANIRSARNSVDRLIGSGYDCGEAEDALDEYDSIDRGDYAGDPEGYKDARDDAWMNFIGVLREVEREDADDDDDEDWWDEEEDMSEVGLV